MVSAYRFSHDPFLNPVAKKNNNAMNNEDPILRLTALKEQIEDLIDQLQNPAPKAARTAKKTSKKAAKKGPTLRSMHEGPGAAAAPPTAGGNKLAIVIGHTRIAPGASGIPPIDASEYPWNTDLAARITADAAGKGVTVKTFTRDVGGVPAAYDAVEAWGARAAIELHYNSTPGAKGTETLYGTACPASLGWATAVQDKMVALYGRSLTTTPPTNRGLKKCPPHPRGGASVNAMSAIPSCLTEPFFADTQTDATLGQTRKQGLAEALVDAFKSHFGV